jgi:DNA-binding LacI/PurR family transcriptional regulator
VTVKNSQETTDKPSSQASIAKELGLSRSTVSAVLSGSTKVHISQETAQRVLEMAKKSDYRPNHYARIMRKGKTRLIGVMQGIGRLQSAHERQVFANMAISQAGYKVMSLAPAWYSGDLSEVENLFVESRVEGVLVSGIYGFTPEGTFSGLEAAGIPYVVLSGRRIPGVPMVRCNVRQSFYELTKLLLESGRRRLTLLVRNRDGWELPGMNWPCEQRIEGFTRAITEFGGTLSVKNLMEIPESGVPWKQKRDHIVGELVYCDLESEGETDPHWIGKVAMDVVARRQSLPHAVMCSNDDWALGVLFSCTQHGISVPGDMAVTGFDNNAEGAYSHPPLTTVAQPNELMARQAVNLLLERVKKEASDDRIHEWLGQIVERSSCGTSRKVKVPA